MAEKTLRKLGAILAGGIAWFDNACVAAQVEGDAVTQATASIEELQEVVVTGSRIRRPAAATEQSLQVIEAEAIEDRGFINAVEAVNSMPQLGTPASPTGDQGISAGRNYINMLNLGSQRTLTLVNGRRFVSSNPPTSSSISPGSQQIPGSQVDFNNIPVGLIDRIEVIQATGTATYGSDAIAGVVNILLKKDFEGVEFDAQLGQAAAGDAFNYLTRATYGVNFSEGRGNFAISYERSSHDGLDAMDRSFFANQYNFAPNPANQSPTDGIPASILIRNWRVPELNDSGVVYAQNAPLPSALLTIPDPNNPGQRVPAQFGPVTCG
jgi:iron complex outermembrane receptor protein